MTTVFHSSKNKDLSLLSPLILLVLLAILFTFFLTASGQRSYTRNANTELMYKNVVTKGDAIRSVLQ